MKEILVSIIIPVYKVEKYLNQCVDSVRNQSYKNLEVILVDDGSPDRCPEICDEYAKKDNRVRVIHQNNGGASVARNAGIKIHTGCYVMFLDGDDFWDDKEAVLKLVDRVRKTNPAVLNYSYKKYFEDCGKKIPQFEKVSARSEDMTDIHEQLEFMTGNGLYIASACNKLILSEVLSEAMHFIEGKRSEDVEWCAKLLSCAKSVDFVCENFYCYRQRLDSYTHTMQEKSCIDLKDSIVACAQIAKQAEESIRKYIYRYTAYQLATFVAVQALAEKCPQECIKTLGEYRWLLSYHGKNKKETGIYYLNKILGFSNMCKMIRFTKNIWM